MSATAVLLCGGAGLDGDSVSGVSAVVDELCRRPGAAAAALRETGASRVVLGLCDRRPPRELVAALHRAGAAPFGVEAVRLDGCGSQEAGRLVAAARAKLDALAPGERGKPVLDGNGFSRRSLLSIAGVLTHAPIAAVDEAACAGTARCGLCVERCTRQAISAAGPVPVIEPGACDACGVCVAGCPHGALRLTGSGTAQIEAQLEQLLPGVEGILFACKAAEASAPRGWALVELPTLALVTPGWILQIRARGAQAGLAPCEGACCAGARDVDSLAGRVLAACEPLRPAGPARTRLVEPLATADAIRRLAAPGATAVLEDAGSRLGSVALDAERCTLCGACAAACPTSALRLDEAAQETILRHEAAACVPCGRCVTACPEDAIEVRRSIDLARLEAGTRDLVSDVRETCDGCGADLPPRAMRRRLRELLPALSGAPLGLCARCASRAATGAAAPLVPAATAARAHGRRG